MYQLLNTINNYLSNQRWASINFQYLLKIIKYQVSVSINDKQVSSISIYQRRTKKRIVNIILQGEGIYVK